MLKKMNRASLVTCSLFIAPLSAWAGETTCVPVNVQLQQATATWSQECAGAFSPANLIDASMASGWGPGRCGGAGPDFTLSETVVFETAINAIVSPGGQVEFTIFSGGAEACCGGGNLTLGSFELFVTNSPRTDFADGLSINGDVTANWVPVSVVSATGVRATAAGVANPGLDPTLALLSESDNLIVSGSNPEYAIYTVRGNVSIGTITGVMIRLVDQNGAATNAVSGLPTGGPGRHSNGNTVIRDIKFAVTQPPSIGLQPNADLVICPGDAIVNSVVPIGTGPFSYNWRKYTDGTPASIGAPNDQALNRLDSTVADAGLYDCVITSACGSTTTNTFRVTVLSADVGIQGGVAGQDSVADNNDFVVFLDQFFANAISADLGKQGGNLGGDGAWDNNDFVAFINLFFAYPLCPPGVD